MKWVACLNDALHAVLRDDPRAMLLGEDLVDPYGGAFKATRGLSTAFPGRVRSTPISEAGIVGLAGGLALGGYHPVVEMMFGDFVTLAFDQIVNHLAKYRAMYAGQVACPVVIRLPSGGGRAYGPTHSQSLEKHLLGVPHLTCAAASPVAHPLPALRALIAGDGPAVFVEHKLLYPHDCDPAADRVGALPVMREDGPLAAACLAPVPRRRCRATVAAYGWMAELARRAVERLAIEEELFVELVVPQRLAPLDADAILASAAATGALLTVEEGTAGWTWGSEVAAVVQRELFGRLRRPVQGVSAPADIIPGARDREREMLPGEDAIVAAIRELCR